MSTDLATLPMPNREPARRPMSRLLDITSSLDGLWNLATLLLDSRLLPAQVDTPQKAVAIILKGDELGIAPMHALEGITVIQGKATIGPQLMLSLIERSGLMEDMQVEETPDSCTITTRRKGRSPQAVKFDRAEAVAMQLTNKDNWKKQFGVMMYWRAVAKMGRRVYPDVIAGCYTPEEMGADVNDDGEIIDGEVMEAPAIEAPARQPSAPGLFSKEHTAKTGEFLAWLNKKCDATNKLWKEEWEAKADGWLERGLNVPARIDDVISSFQARGHLLKWAVAAERLDPTLIPEDLKPGQSERYLALVYFASDEMRGALVAEMRSYVAKQRALKEAAIYRKHPDLAPEGFFEDQAEAARGDAWEPSDADHHAVAEAGGNA